MPDNNFFDNLPDDANEPDMDMFEGFGTTAEDLKCNSCGFIGKMRARVITDRVPYGSTDVPMETLDDTLICPECTGTNIAEVDNEPKELDEPEYSTEIVGKVVDSMKYVDLEGKLDDMDPDWRSRFLTVDQAMDFYQPGWNK